MTTEEVRQKLMNTHHFSEEQIDWGIRAGFKCEYCGRDLLASVDDFDSWHTDHIYPQSKQTEPVQEVKDGLNIAIACKTCNFMKRAEVFGKQPPTSEEERSQMVQLVRQRIAKKRADKQMAVAEIRQSIQDLLGTQAT